MEEKAWEDDFTGWGDDDDGLVGEKGDNVDALYLAGAAVSEADKPPGGDGADDPSPSDCESVDSRSKTPIATQHSTSTMADYMAFKGKGDKSYRGLANHSCISWELKLYFLMLFSYEWTGEFVLVFVDTNKACHEVVVGMRDSELSPGLRVGGRALLVINRRHIVSARMCSGEKHDEPDKILVRDTSSVELPESARKLLLYLNTSHCLTPGRNVEVVLDEKTIQQPFDRGGCCVMALENHRSPDSVYASVEDGESLRKRFGQRVVEQIVCGKTPGDLHGTALDYFAIRSFHRHGWVATIARALCVQCWVTRFLG